MEFVQDCPVDGVESSPDLPLNMLPEEVPKSLTSLDARQLETIYWQACGHDACYKSIAL
jgi:hypothetical protein